MTVAVEILISAPAWGSISAELDKTFRAVVQAALEAGTGPRRCEVSLVLTDDHGIRALNRRYRGRDAATNVLAFATGDDGAVIGPAPVLLGDVVLALETVTAEAAEQGKPPIDHAAHLIVHGVLHLLGFDHLNETDAGEMEAREIAALATLGIRDPYSPRQAKTHERASV